MEAVPDGCRGTELVQDTAGEQELGCVGRLRFLRVKDHSGCFWVRSGRYGAELEKAFCPRDWGKDSLAPLPMRYSSGKLGFEGAHTSGVTAAGEHCREGTGRQVTRSTSLEWLMVCDPSDMVVIPGGSACQMAGSLRRRCLPKPLDIWRVLKMENEPRQNYISCL